MREREIEQCLVRKVKEKGGLCPKWISPGYDGVPDRLVFLVEVKALGKKPRPIQKARHRLLRRLGYQVFVLDDVQQIGGILDEIQK